MMDGSMVCSLVGATLASSVAILLIGILRKPLRLALGARAAYWLWLLVPALVLAVLLPAPPQVLEDAFSLFPGGAGSALSAVLAGAETYRGPSPLFTACVGIWAAGAVAMFASLVRRQLFFSRSLGNLLADESGLRRSGAVVAPMLVGVLHPQIVVPLDFEARYSAEERELMLAHENAHLLRRDVAINALAAAWVCLFWFNPLVYWALGKLRADQELACDALVLQGRVTGRRSYANALLKSQLAAQSSWCLPIECRWQPNHPLKERIAMLKRPLPGISRRSLGICGIVALVASGSYAVWAAQPAAAGNPVILVDISVTATDKHSNETHVVKTRYLVHSGEAPPHLNDSQTRPFDFGCTAFLPDAPVRSSEAQDQKERGIPSLAAGQILLDCVILRDGKIVSKPAVITEDNKLAAVETGDREGAHFRIEIVATTSEASIAAAARKGA